MRINPNRQPRGPSEGFLTVSGVLGALILFFAVFPYVAVYTPEELVLLPPFPVSVDPTTKTINSESDIAFGAGLTLAAAVQGAQEAAAFTAAAIMATKVHEFVLPDLAPHTVVIDPGMRKEQVANVLAATFSWTKDQKQLFLNSVSEETDGEGRLYPSTYLMAASTTPEEALERLGERFDARVLARYASSTEDVVSVHDALTIASIIEREAGSTSEMRTISGILWNRLFRGMRLQADSTLSYARGSSRNGWWPVPRSSDKYIKSPYNTYQNEGLPPGPIASPSVPAIMAALNPEVTTCLYFFHDTTGEFYCSDTYEEHVAKLKSLYGRGR